MKRKLTLLLLLGVLTNYQSFSQEPTITFDFNKTTLQPGDTLTFDARVTLRGGIMRMGTLFLKIVNDKGKIWNMRWPVLDGGTSADIIISDSSLSGPLHCYFAATSNFFAVEGKVTQPKKLKKVKLLLLTEGKDMLTEEIPLDPSGNFIYKNRIFENDAILFFKETNNKNENLDIEIKTTLDSAFAPLARAYQLIRLGNIDENSSPVAAHRYEDIDSVVKQQEKMLAPVTVTAKKKTAAERYQEEYVNGLFMSISERSFDFLDQYKDARFFSVFEFLRVQVPGLSVEISPDGNGYVSWRRSPALFYLDQMKVDFLTLRSIPLSDVALVKVFPAPFAGAPMGNACAIAVYTRRGVFLGNNLKHNFKVKGFTPPIVELNNTSDR